MSFDGVVRAANSSPHILELRIHGIRNTPPAEMLCTSPDSIRTIRGDEYGNFWSLTKPVVSAASDDGPPESVPPHVHREAYSWGTINRRDAGGSTVLGRLGKALTQLAWTLLLPFGLCNVAYWARKIPDPPHTSSGAEPKGSKSGWKHGQGAATVRLFALGLTLLYVIGVSAASLDIVGVQCFPPSADPLANNPTPAKVCSQLPWLLDPLMDASRGQRLAILSIIPLSMLLLLYFVSRRGRVVYEENVYTKELDGTVVSPDDGSLGSPRAPILSTPGFWRHALMSSNTELLHLAASLSLLAGALSFDALRGEWGNCDPLSLSCPLSFPGLLCLFISAGAALLMIVIAVRVAVDSQACPDISAKPGRGREKERPNSERPGRTVAVCLLGASGMAFILTLGATPFADGSPTRPFVTGTITTALVALLLLLSLAALGWRRGLSNRYSLPPLLLMTVCLLLVGWADAAAWPDATPWLLAALGATIYITMLIAVRHRDGRNRYEGWNGSGPGVLMLLALGTAMFLTALVVVGTDLYLRWPSHTGNQTGMWRTRTPEAEIFIPAPYLEFGLILSAIVGLGLSTAVLVALFHMVRHPHSLTTPLPPPPLFRPELHGYRAGRTRQAEHLFRNSLEKVATYRRRQAALAQRGEPILGLTAVLLAVGLTFALTISTTGSRAREWNRLIPWIGEDFENIAKAVAVLVLGAVGIAILGMIIVGIFVQTERPAALIWDLICFLPRAGHPFGPPCYADRVVPEITDRVEEWLASEGPGSSPANDKPEPTKRGVVLSAHSLGAVLAVAVIFNLDEKWRTPSNIGLLTYGTQLRPYFGRFFPELLGPVALGNLRCQGPSLRTADPWLKQVNDDFRNQENANAASTAQPAEVTTQTLVAMLNNGSSNSGPVADATPDSMRGQITWINLWRRTDFLGFPAYSYALNAIDRGAAEFQRHTYMLEVATHAGYPYTEEYRKRLDELTQRMQADHGLQP